MKKFITILVIALMIFVGVSFAAPKEANAQLGIGLLGNYGVIGGGTPLCLDLIFMNYINLAVGWVLQSEGDGSFYTHFGVLFARLLPISPLHMNFGAQLFLYINEPLSLGLRVPVEIGFDIFLFELFMGINPGILIVRAGAPDIGFQLGLSLGFRVWL